MSPGQDNFSQRLAAMVGNGQSNAATRPKPARKPEKVERPAPAGQGDYVVRPGDCISSIARKSGHFWESLWHLPENGDLKAVRIDPNVLLPEDRVFVPPLRPKCEPGEAERRHRFVRRGEPSKLRMVLKRNGKPRANEPYTLEVDGKVLNGTTDPEGKLEVPIPGDAKKGVLTVGEGDNQKKYPLNLGKLEPVTALAGLKGRLNNLGFGCGEVNDVLDEKTRAALKKFQARYELEQTGEPDEPTQDKVKEVHGY